MKWKPIDVISGIIIVGCFVLKAMGQDSAISWTLLGVVGCYYGIDLTPFVKLGRSKKLTSGEE